MPSSGLAVEEDKAGRDRRRSGGGMSMREQGKGKGRTAVEPGMRTREEVGAPTSLTRGLRGERGTAAPERAKGVGSSLCITPALPQHVPNQGCVHHREHLVQMPQGGLASAALVIHGSFPRVSRV